MYYIYWIKPDGEIGTAEVESGKDLYDWTKYEGTYLRCQPYAFIPDRQLWGTYIDMYTRGKFSEKDWKVISPATIPSAIRAYHLITH